MGALAKYDFSCQNDVGIARQVSTAVIGKRWHMQPHLTIDTFGAMLKFLRRRARLTQMELGIAVGYNEAHISRLENGQRLPDLASLAALFVPELDLQEQPEFAARLLDLAARARGKTTPHIETAHTTTETFDIVGTIESIPPLPPYFVSRAMLAQLGEQLAFQRGLVLCGMAGIGKTVDDHRHLARRHRLDALRREAEVQQGHALAGRGEQRPLDRVAQRLDAQRVAGDHHVAQGVEEHQAVGPVELRGQLAADVDQRRPPLARQAALISCMMISVSVSRAR